MNHTYLLCMLIRPESELVLSAKTGWLGATSWAVSMLATPVIIALCRRKSTRLTAVIGGLVLALGILFTSFATELHQVAFSYGMYTNMSK